MPATRVPTPDPTTILGLAVDDDPLFAELIRGVRAAAIGLGLDVRDVAAAGDAVDCDVVLLVGRPARYRDLVSGALGSDGRVGPARWVSWSGEPLPASGSAMPGPVAAGSAPLGRGAPAPIRRGAPRRTAGPVARVLRDLPLAGPPARWRARVLADRLVRANLRELDWVAGHGVGLVVSSRDRAAVLAARGLPARVVPFGYHEASAGPLVPAAADGRALDLVSLGATSRHLRRGGLLAALAADRAGVPLTVIDGVWGPQRDALLRRARVMVDIHRVPGTFVGIRLVLALAAGVAVVTEPMPDPHPFQAGVTHLEAPAERILATARALAADEPRRRQLVTAGQALLTSELAMGRVLAAVIGPSPPRA